MPPMLMNSDGKPYTGVDAVRFLTMLREGAYNPMGPVGKGGWSKPTTSHGMTPVGDKQMSVKDVVARQVLLRAAIKNSYDEHTRKLGTQDALFDLARYVAFKSGAVFVPGPMKTFERMLEKVMDYKVKVVNGKKERGYEGDYGKVKDEVRCTLVGDDAATYAAACDVMRAVCHAGNGLSFIKNNTRDPNLDPCGYSDTNIVVKLPNGQPGEVQINNRAVLYGKMAKQKFIYEVGVPEREYAMLEAGYGIEGGLGHALYEIWQKNFAGTSQRAGELGKRYYGLLRAYPRVDPGARAQLVRDLDEFKAKPELAGFFTHG